MCDFSSDRINVLITFRGSGNTVRSGNAVSAGVLGQVGVFFLTEEETLLSKDLGF